MTIDNLANGLPQTVKWGPFYKGAIQDESVLQKILREHKISAAIHCAGSAYVHESVENPLKYYENNFINSFYFFKALSESGIKHFIFSSSSTVYGEPGIKDPVDESFAKVPVNPYGQTKWITEKLIEDLTRVFGIKCAILRYFNVSGSDSDKDLSIVHNQQLRLIPMAFTASENQSTLNIFGKDHATADGSCVRDYVHVQDVARAHLKALNYIFASEKSCDAFNIGSGKGTSVLQIINQVGALTGKPIKHEILPRRHGETSAVVSNCTKAKDILKWEPETSDLKTIISSAAAAFLQK